MKAIFEAIEAKTNIQPPKTVFIPSKELLRKMIRALIKYERDDPEKLFLRFGLIENFKIKKVSDECSLPPIVTKKATFVT